VDSRPDTVLIALKSLQATQHEALAKLAVPWFHSMNSHIRYYALNLFFNQIHPQERRKDLEELAFRFCLDADAHVQTLMLEKLLQLDFCRQFRLDMYRRFVGLLIDEDPMVRRASLDLVLQIAQKHGDTRVPATSLLYRPDSATLEQQLVRMRSAMTGLADDAFLRFCDVVNTDVDTEVRAKACRCLAAVRGVDEMLIKQSLEQDLVCARKRKRGSTKEPVLEIEVTSCGAIVTALQDDAPSLRAASLQALMSMSLYNPQLAEQTLSVLLYSTHDTLGHIRDLALQGVLNLVKRGKSLDVEQLGNMLSLLHDCDSACRLSVLQIISFITLAGTESLAVTLASLHNHLVSYPANESLVFRTIACLGRNNHKLLGMLSRN